jgi:ADP-heptose:LPS heptosyltransferase
MVATADLVITPDTAISHVASAFSRPTLTLLRKDFERLVPYRTPGRNVFSDDADGLVGLPATRAIRALDEMLDER